VEPSGIPEYTKLRTDTILQENILEDLRANICPGIGGTPVPEPNYLAERAILAPKNRDVTISTARFYVVSRAENPRMKVLIHWTLATDRHIPRIVTRVRAAGPPRHRQLQPLQQTTRASKPPAPPLNQNRKGTRIGVAKADDPEADHNPHGRPSRHQTGGLGGDWPRPKARAPGKKAHRSATENPAGYHHRDPVVPGTQGGRRQRKGRRVGQDRGGGARRPRSGVARLPGSDGSMRYAASQFSRAPQARNLRGKVGGDTTMGRRSDLEEKIQDAEKPEVSRRDGWEL